jgi:hypothetical protein
MMQSRKALAESIHRILPLWQCYKRHSCANLAIENEATAHFRLRFVKTHNLAHKKTNIRPPLR